MRWRPPTWARWSLTQARTAVDATADTAAATEAGTAEASTGEVGTSEAVLDDHPASDEDPTSCPTGATPGGESFAAGTLVLLASGKAVPISELKVGDKVPATDTKTGKDQPETVTAVLVHHEYRPVRPHRQNQSRHRGHPHHQQPPFWDPYPHYGWVPAKQPRTRHAPPDPRRHNRLVARGTVPEVHDGWMWT